MSNPKKRRRPPEQRGSGDKSSPIRRWLWIAAVVVALAGVVAVAATEGSPEAGPGGPRDPQAVAEGAVLYAANCASCHGADLMGTGTGPPFLDVTYAPNHHADEAFQRAVAFGVQPHHWNFGPMVPVEGLGRDEVALIVEFVRAEQEAAGIFRDPRHP